VNTEDSTRRSYFAPTYSSFFVRDHQLVSAKMRYNKSIEAFWPVILLDSHSVREFLVVRRNFDAAGRKDRLGRPNLGHP
jgi:hypothetical protein